MGDRGVPTIELWPIREDSAEPNEADAHDEARDTAAKRLISEANDRTTPSDWIRQLTARIRMAFYGSIAHESDSQNRRLAKFLKALVAVVTLLVLAVLLIQYWLLPYRVVYETWFIGTISFVIPDFWKIPFVGSTLVGMISVYVTGLVGYSGLYLIDTYKSREGIEAARLTSREGAVSCHAVATDHQPSAVVNLVNRVLPARLRRRWQDVSTDERDTAIIRLLDSVAPAGLQRRIDTTDESGRARSLVTTPETVDVDEAVIQTAALPEGYTVMYGILYAEWESPVDDIETCSEIAADHNMQLREKIINEIGSKTANFPQIATIVVSHRVIPARDYSAKSGAARGNAAKVQPVCVVAGEPNACQEALKCVRKVHNAALFGSSEDCGITMTTGTVDESEPVPEPLRRPVANSPTPLWRPGESHTDLLTVNEDELAEIIPYPELTRKTHQYLLSESRADVGHPTQPTNLDRFVDDADADDPNNDSNPGVSG